MAIVYGCDNWPFLWYTQQAWILSRTRTLSEDKIQMAKNIIDNKINTGDKKQYDYDKQWILTNQGSDCKYAKAVVDKMN